MFFRTGIAKAQPKRRFLRRMFSVKRALPMSGKALLLLSENTVMVSVFLSSFCKQYIEKFGKTQPTLRRICKNRMYFFGRFFVRAEKMQTGS